ncbi:hypothetical protein WOA01_07190 [Methylocystis sp. IM2]|uniref:hypothetical protein n=1 Tax=Methylocystis sp. IM2 TaxID=3136563 RepID=UPI0030F816EF
MSHGGVSERIGFLRRRIAAIEARDGAASALPAGRLADLSADLSAMGGGGASLDALLSAGHGNLSEALPARAPDAPAAAAFALAMALRARAARGGARWSSFWRISARGNSACPMGAAWRRRGWTFPASP